MAVILRVTVSFLFNRLAFLSRNEALERRYWRHIAYCSSTIMTLAVHYWPSQIFFRNSKTAFTPPWKENMLLGYYEYRLPAVFLWRKWLGGRRSKFIKTQK